MLYLLHFLIKCRINLLTFVKRKKEKGRERKGVRGEGRHGTVEMFDLDCTESVNRFGKKPCLYFVKSSISSHAVSLFYEIFFLVVLKDLKFNSSVIFSRGLVCALFAVRKLIFKNSIISSII